MVAHQLTLWSAGPRPTASAAVIRWEAVESLAFGDLGPADRLDGIVQTASFPAAESAACAELQHIAELPRGRCGRGPVHSWSLTLRSTQGGAVHRYVRVMRPTRGRVHVELF